MPPATPAKAGQDDMKGKLPAAGYPGGSPLPAGSPEAAQPPAPPGPGTTLPAVPAADTGTGEKKEPPAPGVPVPSPGSTPTKPVEGKPELKQVEPVPPPPGGLTQPPRPGAAPPPPPGAPTKADAPLQRITMEASPPARSPVAPAVGAEPAAKTTSGEPIQKSSFDTSPPAAGGPTGANVQLGGPRPATTPPASRAGEPAPFPADAWKGAPPKVAALPPVAAPAVAQPQAISYTVDLHDSKAGDTWESLSKQYYGTTEAAAALREFNRSTPRASDRLRRDGTIAAGDPVFIPQLSILQRHGLKMRPLGAPGSTPPASGKMP